MVLKAEGLLLQRWEGRGLYFRRGFLLDHAVLPLVDLVHQDYGFRHDVLVVLNVEELVLMQVVDIIFFLIDGLAGWLRQGSLHLLKRVSDINLSTSPVDGQTPLRCFHSLHAAVAD